MSTENSVELAEDVIQKLDDMVVSADDKKPERERRPRQTEEERRREWEEKQAQKKLVESGVKGKVKWYSVRGKYGFIARDDEKPDVFVHQTAISKSAINKWFLRTLDDNEEVEFDVVDGDKGPEAANVTGPEGGDVRGCRYYFILCGPRNGRERRGKGEGEEKTEKSRPRRSNKNRRHRPSKKSDDAKDNEKESEQESEIEESGRRRSVSPSRKNKSQTKLPNTPKEAGDASLGGQLAAPAAVN